ncbi:MAG: PH domain-containing protein [Gammaproteobacteria bacterium]|nr:PH domain-containing protein [Gammaproteobacteria bacterium]
MTTERRFGTRVDRWLVRSLIALTVISFVAAYQALVMPGGGKWFALVIILAGAGLPFWVLRSTAYTVSEDLLDIRSGPFSWRIRLGEIESVHPTRSPRSGPALSLDRLCITYRGGRHVLVSPEDRDGFLAAIGQSRAPP